MTVIAHPELEELDRYRFGRLRLRQGQGSGLALAGAGKGDPPGGTP
jgi:hypothetical protein